MKSTAPAPRANPRIFTPPQRIPKFNDQEPQKQRLLFEKRPEDIYFRCLS